VLVKTCLGIIIIISISSSSGKKHPVTRKLDIKLQEECECDENQHENVAVITGVDVENYFVQVFLLNSPSFPI